MDTVVTLAILRQAITYVREGNMRRARALGFNDDELRELRRLSATDIDALATSNPVVCRLSVDHDLLAGVFRRLSSDMDREKTIDRCLELGASVLMMSSFFGLTGNDCSTRRALLGLESRQGRVAMPPESEEHDAFRRWQDISAATTAPDAVDDIQGMIVLCEETSIPLGVVWQLVKNWTKAVNSSSRSKLQLADGRKACAR
ncbi:DUF2857 domain-containing protein [Halopseudomonas bauzanensis]|uniref:DUF2857 domain-containing protein n=1 Tax=Halopseudomonas bauzanensis TaxID=653930 RepID=UPI003525EEE1